MTQTLHLTYEQALDGLQKAVKERGEDFVYPAEWKDGSHSNWCVNFLPDWQPACIAGVVYAQHGIRPTSDDWRLESVDSLKEVGLLEIDNRTQLLLQQAQAFQDQGSTWGEALRLAVEAVEQYDKTGV